MSVRAFRRPACAALGLLAALAVSGPARADFESQLRSVAAKIVTDLPTFFFDNFQECTTNLSPLYMGKRYEISSNLFPSFLPWGELNIAGKGQLHREHGYWPQIDVLAGGWTSLFAFMLPSDVKDDMDPSFYGYNAGLILSESLDPRLRLFFGYSYSQLRVQASLKEIKEEEDSADEWDFIPDTVNVGKAAHYFIIGAELLRTPEKRLISQVGYGFISNRFTARLMWSSKRFDTGLIFFPEGYPLILWPVWNVQVRF